MEIKPFDPFAHLLANAQMKRRIADHALLADFLTPDFELRFDQRYQTASPFGEFQRPFEHL